jgi:hypothetical protein
MRADGANVHGWGERCAEYTGLATGISSHHVPTALQRQKHQRPHTHGSMLPWSTLMQAPTTHLLIYIQIRLMLWSGEGRRASVLGGGGAASGMWWCTHLGRHWQRSPRAPGMAGCPQGLHVPQRTKDVCSLPPTMSGACASGRTSSPRRKVHRERNMRRRAGRAIKVFAIKVFAIKVFAKAPFLVHP